MSRPPAAQAIYIDLAPDPLFGLLHAPAGSASGIGVLLCPPWGWEDVASYRSRRTWAEHLARAGHAALRFDFPAAGDSGGSPRDPGRLDAWSGAIVAACDWLRANGGCHRVAVLGLGLSGLIAGKALDEGARIDDLVLWAAPPRGRSFLRTQRAFSRLQSSRYSQAGEILPSGLPEGWMEIGGFVLSADTIGELEQLDVCETATQGLQRVLLLDRDGAGIDEDVHAHFADAGVAVTFGAGHGWEAMVADPQRPDPPLEVFERVASWLAEAPERAGAAPVPSGPPRQDIVLEVDGASITESALVMELAFGRIFGVLAEPARGSSSTLCAVFVNAGAVRRIGPSRMWTEAARRWAARGVPAVRLDLEGIGDADGDGSRYRDVNEFYVQDAVDQVTHAIDELHARGVGERFVVIGLCSGGYWAFHAAMLKERVSAAFLVNAGALYWDSGLVVRREVHKLDRLRQRAWWGRILRGKVKVANMRTVVRALATSATRIASRTGGRTREDAAGTWIGQALDLLRDSNTRVVMAFSEDEALRAELAREGVIARLDRWPNVALASLPGRDHTLRHATAQRAVHDLLDRELQRELARAGDLRRLSAV
jgi:alpha-beta hydrolase superfamily lysophospholipase